jgi:hypothetical protein
MLKTGAAAEALRKQLYERTLFAHRIGSAGPQVEHWAVIYRHWKLIDWHGNRRELYNHRSDPQEQKNVLGKHPLSVKKLADELTDLKQRTAKQEQGRQVAVGLDQEMLDNLKALGYVEED